MRKYVKKFHIRDSFPIAYGETWNVRQSNKIVERWHVDYVNDKNTIAEIHITELEEDENDHYYN